MGLTRIELSGCNGHSKILPTCPFQEAMNYINIAYPVVNDENG